MNLLYANDRAGAYPDSWYAATAALPPPTASLHGAARADIGIVGAGYTGLSAALHLAKAGYSVRLLEAHRVGWGASGRNGGQLGSGQRVEQLELEQLVGNDQAKQLWTLAEASKALVKSLIEQHQIECQLTPGILHADHKPRYVAQSQRFAEHMQKRYNYQAITFLDRAEMQQQVASDNYHGGTLDHDAAHLHPLNYALGLAAGAQYAGAVVNEMTPVLGCQPTAKGWRLTSENGHLDCGTVLLACNGYLGNLEPKVARRVMPINNFIIATEPLGEAGARALIRDNHAVADSRFVVNYFRLSNDHRLLFGGGENYGYRFPRDIKSFVRRPMLAVFPQLQSTRIDYGWGGTLAITVNRLPWLRRVRTGLYSCSGYSGHGVGMATLAGQLVSEAIRGDNERFDVMASLPSMPFPGGSLLRTPLLATAMLWYALRDRL
ncbi:FAD-binding oxidoreductase [Gammaproteobacteria bacterium]|nr:FAD-binding oxidoreductase [Gammaproteobacteria bacterium]